MLFSFNMIFRKVIFAAALVFFCLTESIASHIMGGSMTYTYVSYNSATHLYTYKVTIKMYRDCINGQVELPNSQEVGAYKQDASNPNTSKVLYNTFTIDRISLQQIALPGQTAGCNFASNVCVEEGVYEGNITVPFNAGGYHLIAEDCARNAAIINLLDAGSQGQAYYAFIPPNYIVNSSPIFVDAPVPYICVGDTASLLNSVTDPDGDVLTYSFVVPYQGLACISGALPDPYDFPITPVNYNTGYNETTPFGSGGYASINAANGLTRYKSNVQGLFVVAVEIKEYRNNQLIGRTRRDLQIVVVNCPANSSPVMTSGSSGTVVTDYTINAGSNLCFNVSASDPGGDSLYLVKTGSVFNSSEVNPPATLSNSSGDGFVGSQFCWSTSCSQAGTYIFYVKITDNGCPPKTLNQVYTINVLPFGPSSITGSNSVCSGQTGSSYSVPVATGVTYTWAVTGGTIVSGAGTNAITVNWGTGASGNVTITETNTLGCTSTPVSLSVAIKPLPTANAGSDKSTCPGTPVQIGSSPVSGTSYAWTPTTNLSSATVSNPNASPSVNTTYILTATGANSCTKKDTVVVSVNTQPTIAVTPGSATVCNGGSATLTASGGVTYTWSPSTGLNTTSGSTVIATPAATTTYTVVGANGASCANSSTVTVSVAAATSSLITPSALSFCSGSSSTLTASGSDTYSWTPSTGLSATTGSSVTATPSATTIYTVTGTTTGGCVSVDTVLLTVKTSPTVTGSASPYAVCNGLTSTLSATGASSYSWSPSTGLSASTGTPVTATVTSNIIYTVTGTAANGCTKTDTVTMIVKALPTVVGSASPYAVCNGSISSLTATGASTYSWSPSTGLSAATGTPVTATITGNTIYTLTGTATNGCVKTDTVTMTVKSLPTVTASANPYAVCNGSTSLLTAAGASTYTWSPSAGLSTSTGSPVTATVTANTVYTVTGTSAAGCSATDTVTMVVKALPSVIGSAAPYAVCNGLTSTLSATGASSYSWSPATGLSTNTGTPVTATVTSTTTYTVTGTATNGCVKTDTVKMTVKSLPTVTGAANPYAVCNGLTSALTVNGASSYSWSPSTGLSTTSGTPVIATVSSNIIYTVTGTAANGCIKTDTVTIVVKSLPTVTASANPYSVCNGSTSVLSASGANTYAWLPVSGLSSGSGATVTATVTANTVYTVTGTSATGCTAKDTVTMTVKALPTTTGSASPYAVCSGLTSALTASGASAYSWSPSTGLNASTGTPVTATVMANTIYTVTGTAANGCIKTDTITMVVKALPAVVGSALPYAVCNGLTSNLTATGASTYSWSPSAGLSASTGTPVTATVTANTIYTVTGTATNGCIKTDTVTMVVKTVPTVTASANPYAVCNGSTSPLTATGASTYSWSPSAGLSASTGSSVTATVTVNTVYTVTGASAAGCSATDTVTMTVKAVPSVTGDAAPYAVCSGLTSTLTASGASSYSWSPSTGLSASAGTPVTATVTTNTIYTVTGTAVNGCIKTDTVTMAVKALPTVVGSASPYAVCNGLTSSLTATGASTYSWSPSAGLSASTGTPVTATITSNIIYTVTGTATNGCIATDTVTMIVKTVPTVTASANPYAVCNGLTSPLTAAGASAYSWSPLTGLGASTGSSVTATITSDIIYTVTGTSSLGCSNTDTVTMTVKALPSVIGDASPYAVCSGLTSALTANGASTYSWSPSAGLSANSGTPVTATVTSNTIYTVTGTAANGCINSDTVTMIVKTLPTVTASANPYAVCNGLTSDLTASGASTYLWSPAAGLNSTTGTPVTATVTSDVIYTVTGTAANGCLATDTVTMVVKSLPTVTTSANPYSVCSGLTSDLTANGAFTYSWSPSGGLSADTGSPVIATITSDIIYTVTGTAVNGCIGSDTVAMVVKALPVVTSTAAPAEICVGQSSSLSASGADTYVWSPSTSLDTNIGANVVSTPLSTITYIVTGTNTATGCIDTSVSTVTVNPLPLVAINPLSDTLCAGENVDLTASGALSYAWSPATALSATTGSVVNASPANTIVYTVIGTDANSCVDTNTVAITVNQLPLTDAGSYKVICEYDSIQLSATGALNYVWTNGASLSDSLIADPYASPMLTTLYTVTATDGNNCVASDTVSVIVNPVPVADAGNGSVICYGQSANLSANGGTSYTWSPGASLSDSTLQNPVASPVTSQLYTYHAFFATGCKSMDTVSVYVNAVPDANAGNDTVICYGNNVIIGTAPVAGNSYSWMPSTYLDGTNSSMQVSSPLASVTYTLIETIDATGCVDTDYVSITVNPLPVTDAGRDTALCFGQSASIGVAPLVGNTYLWQPGSGLNDSTISSPVSGPAVTTTYILSQTIDLTGCSNSDTVTVVINPLPAADAGPDLWICPGGSIGLNATGGVNYVWSPGASLNDSAIASPTASPLVTTDYVVTVTDANNCSKNDTVNVLINPKVPVNAGSDKTICFGDNIVLGSSPTAPAGTVYTWSTLTGLNDSTVANPSASPMDTLTYILYVTNDTCSNSDTVIVNVNQLPLINAGSDVAICYGDSASLSATGAASYLWSPSTGLNDSTIANPVTNALSSVNYTVQGTDVNNCISYDTLNITVNPLPVSFAGNDTSICFGDSAKVGAAKINGYLYSWQSVPAGYTSSLADPFVNADSTTLYVLTVTDSVTLCISMDSVLVTVNPLPVNTLNADTTICNGASVLLGQSSVAGQTYTWTSMPAGTISSNSSVLITPSVTTVYYLNEEISATGCKLSDSVTVTVNPLPNTDAGTDTAICLGATAGIGMDSVAGNTYNWTSNPVGYNSTVSNPVVSPLQTTTYYLTEIITATGCVNTDSVVITVNPLPMALTGNDTAVCYGSPVTVGKDSVPGNSYAWSSNPAGQTAAVSNPVFTPLSTTTYYLTETINTTGCSYSDSVTVVVNPLPIPDAGNDTTVCFGVSVAIGKLAIIGNSYSWSSNPSGFSSTVSDPAVTPQLTTTYYLFESIDATTCSAIDSVTVTVNALPIAYTGNDTTVCIGTVVAIGTATLANHTYTWTSNPVGFSSNNSTENVSPLVTTTYYLTEADTITGCSQSDSVTITVNQLPVADVGTDTVICFGAMASIGSADISTNTYSWYSVPTGFSASVSDSVIQPQQTTTYYVNVVSILTGCINNDSVLVAVNPLPVITISNDTALCIGADVTLSADSIADMAYTWSSNPAGTSSSLTAITVAPAVTTTYYLTQTNTTTSCYSQDSVVVAVNPLPLVDAGLDTILCLGTSYTTGQAAVAGHDYTWSSMPAGTTSANSIITVSPDTTTTYYLTETISLTGCVASDSVIITVNPLPNTDAGTDTAICFGAATQIGMDSVVGNTYNWTSNPVGYSSTVSNPVVSPLQTTTYYLTEIIIATGCINTDSVVITVNPLPMALTGSDTAICYGSPVTIGKDSITGNSYVWSSNPVGQTAAVSNPVFTPLSTTTYYLTEIINTTGCSYSDSVTVTVNPLPIPDAGDDTTVCFGVSVSIGESAILGNSYSWSSNPAGFSSTVSDPAVTPQLTTTYYLFESIDATTCSAIDSVTITVNALPIAYTGNDTTVCIGTIVAIGTAALADHTYTWTSNPAGFSSNNSTENVSPLVTTTYYLTEADTITGCSQSDSVTITVNQLPVADAGTDTVICFGAMATIGSTDISTNTYSWYSVPGGFTASVSDSVIQPQQTATYYVNVISTLTGCVNNDSVLVTVNPLPAITISNDTALCLGAIVTLSADSINGMTYTWTSNPAGLVSNFTAINVSPDATTTYYLTQTNSATSCYSQDSVVVIVNPLPDVFAGNDTALCIGSVFIAGQPALADNVYTWSSNPVGFTSADAQPLLNPDTTTIYYVTQTNSLTGCSSSDTVNVVVNNLPVIELGNDTAICKGNSIQLGNDVSLAYNYIWSSNPSGINDSIAIITVMPNSTAVYYETKTDTLTGCSNLDSIKVTVNALPLAVTGNDTTICDGITVQLGTASISAHSYSWMSIPAGYSDTMSAVNVSPDILTTYVLTEFDSISTCVFSDSVTITVNPIPATPVLNSNSPVCVGDTILLGTTSQSDQYFWTGPNAYSDTVQNPVIANATTSMEGYYSLTVADLGCFSASDSVFIKIVRPAIVNAGSDLLVCQGTDTVSLQGTVMSISSTGIWSSSGTGLFSPSDTLLTTNYHFGANDTLGTFTFVLSSTHNNNCPAVTDTVLVTIGTIPVVSAGSDLIICSNTPDVPLSGAVKGGFGSGIWSVLNSSGEFNPNDSALITSYTPSLVDIESGALTFVLNSTHACRTESDTIKVKYVQPPVVDFEATETPFNVNETITFTPAASDAVSWLWDFGDNIGTSEDSIPKYSYPLNGSYTVQLMETNGFGCTDTLEKIIDINVVPLLVPTAFTPNGDGANDVLYVKGGPFKQLEFRVYNEWGNLLFTSTDQSVGWDATYKGVEQPGGTYTYTVIGIDTANKETRTTGDVTLIR